MVEGVIFDLDGTLLDTLDTLARAHNHALEVHGFPTHEASAYRYFIGNGAAVCVERSLPVDARDAATCARVTRAFQACYADAWQDGTTPYPGIVDLLQTLKQKGVGLAVLSNKDHPFTSRIIQHFFAPGLFAVVQGHDATVPHKPSPVGVRKIAEKMGLPLSALMMVGDTSVDIETAVNSGVTGVGVTWGFREVDELLAAGARHIIDQPHELILLI